MPGRNCSLQTKGIGEKTIFIEWQNRGGVGENSTVTRMEGGRVVFLLQKASHIGFLQLMPCETVGLLLESKDSWMSSQAQGHSSQSCGQWFSPLFQFILH